MVVLSMITKDTVERIGDKFFRLVLRSTLQVPYKSIILIDDSKNNATRQIIREFSRNYSKEVIISSTEELRGIKSRGFARQMAIDLFLLNFSDDWLFFLDDDCIMKYGWWNEASRYIGQQDVGIIWGINWDLMPERKVLLSKLNIDYETDLINQFLIRGGTHDTLLRREALKELNERNIRIPPELHILEDAYLFHSIRCLGYRFAVLKTGVIHLNINAIDANVSKIHELLYLYTLYKYGIKAITIEHTLWKNTMSILRSLIVVPLNTYAAIIGNRTGAFTRVVARVRSRIRLKIIALKFLYKLGNPPKDICEKILTERRKNGDI